jgi:murein DD-endopeptidase MepM/ murein hydrolase activator NlpD
MRGAGLICALAALLLSGCIPRGGDYAVKTNSDAGGTASEIPRSPVVLIPETEVIAPTPSWNPAIVERNAQLVDSKIWVVRSGDTLFRIGNESGAGPDAIARANNLFAPYTLRAGQRLQIPGGLYHRISAGETGIAIARAYGAPWTEIVSLNGLSEPYVLRAGQFLRLPDSASAVPVNGKPPQPADDEFTLDIDAIVTGSQPAKPEPGRPAPALGTPVATPSVYAGSFIWPITGRVISRFGSQGGGRVNDGLNIAASLGAAVTSAGDGVVVYAGNEISVFGGLIMVDHGGGWITAYGHLGQLNVARGAKVRRGQALGTVGDTGYVDTPQLHFEIRKDRKPVDPLTKLPAR